MPRNITITLENGQTHTYQNAPDSLTPEAVQARAERDFGMPVVGIDGGRKHEEKSLSDKALEQVGNLAAGALRGAGSIGATLLTPIDAAARAVGIQNDYIGRTDRRQAMDEALRGMGADTDSLAFKTGKIGAEIAGTAGAGGVLAKGMTAIPGVASKAPLLAEALKSGGMTLGGTTGSRMADMGIRMVGGGATGAAAAGLVNPEDAAAGGVIGAVMPPAIQGAASVGKAIGNSMVQKYADAVSKFNRNEPLRQTLKESVEAGYVVPPNMVNPSAKNQILESFSGKQATSQMASVRNQEVSDKLVRQALGLADDAPLTKGALEKMRKSAGTAYDDVAKLSPKAEMDLEALKQARNEAQGWFNAYNRSASPADLAKAKDARDLAEVLELQLESHAKQAGKDELIPALREARKQIAKTYTVERALNDASGTVNAKVLGRIYEKGKPLSDGLETVGRFANAFPSVNQSMQQMGSPAAHNLRAMASMLAGGSGLAAAGPAGLAAAGIPFVAGPAARSLMFRKSAQEALANAAAPKASRAAQLALMLSNPEVQMAISRSAPVIALDR